MRSHITVFEYIHAKSRHAVTNCMQIIQRGMITSAMPQDIAPSSVGSRRRPRLVFESEKPIGLDSSLLAFSLNKTFNGTGDTYETPLHHYCSRPHSMFC